MTHEQEALGLLHTSATLVPIFEQLCKAKLPGVAVFNLVDDSLIKDVIAHGQLRPQTARRVPQLVAAAEDAGADYIMVTCSSIGAAVETAATLAAVPVLRVDQPMADRAVDHGRADRRDRHAADHARTDGRPDPPPCCRREPRDRTDVAPLRGCVRRPDERRRGDARRDWSPPHSTSCPQVDVIALAQASMARVVDTLSENERRNRSSPARRSRWTISLAFCGKPRYTAVYGKLHGGSRLLLAGCSFTTNCRAGDDVADPP